MTHTQVYVQRKVQNGAYNAWVSLFIRILHASQCDSQGIVLYMHTGHRALLLWSLKRTSDTVMDTPSSTDMALERLPVLADLAMHSSYEPLTQPDGPHPEIPNVQVQALKRILPSTQPDGPHPETLFASHSLSIELDTSSRRDPPSQPHTITC